MTEIDEEVLDRLEAEAKVAEADVEELTIAVESDIESTESEVEELQEEVAEKESEVEELQSELEEKEEKVEEMNEKMESVADTYAEELAKHNDVLDKEDFLGKFEFEELQEKYENLEDSSPAPNSGDPGAGFQSPDNGGDGGSGESEELSNKAKVASEQFERRGGVWKDVAEDIEENGLGEVRKRGDGEEVFA